VVVAALVCSVLGQDSRSQLLVRERRLFDWSDIGTSLTSAAEWATTTTEQIANQAVGLTEAATLFQSSDVYLNQGLTLGKAAWESILELCQKMVTIFNQFEPLKSVFADKNGLVTLLTNTGDMQLLVNTTREILSTNSVLDALANAVDQIAVVFADIQKTLTDIITKLSGTSTSRRLSSYEDLLSGINFDTIVTSMKGFAAQFKQQAEDLTDIDTILGPLLAKMQGSGGRRLDNIMEDKDKYARAVSKIIPAWQAVETTGVSMCPEVEMVTDTLANLQCRVTQFASSAALPSWVPSEVTNIVGNCKSSAPAATSTNSCPAKALSADVPNMLGENSQQIGWILAIAGACGLLGGGGAIALCKKKSGDDDESDDSNSEETGLVAS